MGELSKLPNIGKVVEEQLNQVGILYRRRFKKSWSQAGLVKDTAD